VFTVILLLVLPGFTVQICEKKREKAEKQKEGRDISRVLI
jgi:hypothetical protein